MPEYDFEEQAMAGLAGVVKGFRRWLENRVVIKMDRQARALLDPIAVAVEQLKDLDAAITCSDGARYLVHTKHVAEGNRIVLRKAFSNLLGSEFRLLSYNYNSGVAVAEKVSPWA